LRSERVKAAQAALAPIKRQGAEPEERRGNGKKPKDPRASTTDPKARVIKMADGGFRPAYNVQVASAAGAQIVAAVSNCGSDRGLMRPMLERLRALTGRFPKRHLADGGFCSAETIAWAHGEGVEVYCPPIQSKHGTDPYSARRRRGGVGLARPDGERSGQGAVQCRAICECIHACWRNWGPAATDRARHQKAPRRRALLRARQQHFARPPSRQLIEEEPSTQISPTHCRTNAPPSATVQRTYAPPERCQPHPENPPNPKNFTTSQGEGEERWRSLA
jgi:hypothetical protein